MRSRKVTKRRARGKWHGIIERLIGPDAIAEKHGPCPICGGKDRYRFDNKRNNGDWICNVCGVGDGFELLQRVLGVSFSDAAKMVDGIVGSVEEVEFREEPNLVKRRDNLLQLWKQAKDPQVMRDYLWRRCIPTEVISAVCDLRGIKGMKDWNTGFVWPGMVAIVRDPAGRPVTVHRTYFGMENGKRLMPPIGKWVGGAIRLGQPTDTLILAEGIETALSAWSLFKHPAWALISAQNFDQFSVLPDCVRRVMICADHDVSFTGQAASFRLAWRLKNGKRKLFVRVMMPMQPGHDMNDVLRFGGNYHAWEYGTDE